MVVKRYTDILLLLTLLFISQNAPAYTVCDWPTQYSLNSIVQINIGDTGFASGVVVNQDRVLTAAHALVSSEEIFVHVNNHRNHASVVLLDQAKDLAVLAVVTESLPVLEMRTRELGDNESVWAVGYPRAQYLSTSSGAFHKNQDGVLHASASIDLGESGGGLLLCEQGEYYLAGMLRGYGTYLIDDTVVRLDNYSMSVSAQEIDNFLIKQHLPVAAVTP